MADQTIIKKINDAIKAYFEKNPSIVIVPVKKLMPDFISAGIFVKDNKNGMPIRKILRDLEKSKQLKLIPFIHSERKGQAIYWYFIPKNAEAPTTPYKQDEKNPETIQTALDRANSDETYVIDLCDTVIEQKANRQKRFDFLLGDYHKDGRSRTKLHVDAYYESLKLVVEYREKIQSDNEDKDSSVSKSWEKQKFKYDQRREEVLPENDIKLVIINYSDFKCDSQGKIIRKKESDFNVVQKALK